MKKIFQTFILVFLAASAVFYLSSCEKEEVAEPFINYVRVTNPAVSDSLLAGAGQGQMVAIVGHNLSKATEVWFNDQKSLLIPTFVSDSAILVSVPTNIPQEITNQLKVVFSDGKVLYHNFKTEISKPLINYMRTEYVATGDTVSIVGDFFYAPLTVTFTGGVQGEVQRITPQEIAVTVPEGAQPGPITITTNFGTRKSDFYFRDNRNIVLSSDPFTGWWNPSLVVSAPGAGDPPLINGNYFRINEQIGGWQWTELAGGPPSAMGEISKNFPAEAILKPQDYNLKFEINTLKPFNSNVIRLNFGLADNFVNDGYQWLPPIDTKGKWQTITIPFDEVAAGMGGNLKVSDAGYYTRVMIFGPGDLDADIAFDNFRIVPKIIK